MKTAFLPLCLVGIVPLAAAEPPIPQFRSVDVDTKVEIGYGVAVADIDGDKKPDILLADKNLIVWYRNPTWEKFIIAEKLTELDHVCIAAADIDGDGKAEVAAGAGWNPGDTVNSGSVHYLIPPSDRTQRWEPVKLPHEPTVHRMRWVKNEKGKSDLVVVPLHGRGNKSGEGAGVRIMAYQKPTDPKQPWVTAALDESLHMTHNFDLVTWDNDNAQELLVAGKEGVFLLDPFGNLAKRTQVGGNEGGGAGEVRLGKLPGGKRFIATIEPMHGNQVVVYTPPPANQTNTLWSRNAIDDSIKDGHAVGCGDLLGLGADQLVIGWRNMRGQGNTGVRLYIPLDAEGKNWKPTTIDGDGMACEDLCLADLNSDGKLDIIAAGRATKNLKIYFNLGTSIKN